MARTRLLVISLVAVIAVSAGCGGESPTTPTEAESANGARPQHEARGAVSNVRGSCPSLRFIVGDNTIVTNAETEFAGGTCSQVTGGVMVAAVGPRLGSTIGARRVEFDSRGGGEGGGGGAAETTVEGRLSGLSGTCAAVVFTVDGRVVRTTTATEYARVTCSDLADGMMVIARGPLQEDLSLRATRVERR